MINIQIIIFLLYAHWVADFYLQDVRWAAAKSHCVIALWKHVLVYSTTMAVVFLPISLTHFDDVGKGIYAVFLFFSITLVTHFYIDLFTSKVVKDKFEKKEYGTPIPNTGAFTVIGFDQFLHYTQIFVTICYIQNM